MKRKSLSLIAIVLTVCFTVSSFPLQALSLGTLSATDSVSDSESSDIFVVEEDITKRGEYEKHFLCSDGTYRAVTYAEPVHYYDSSTSTWQDNDVALTLNADSSRYEAQSGSFAVSFANAYAALALSAAGTMGEETSNALTTSGSASQSDAASQAQTVAMTNGTYPISWTTAVKPSSTLFESESSAFAEQAASALTANTAAAVSGPIPAASASSLLTRTPTASILTAEEAEATAQQSFVGKPISDADVLSLIHI